MMNVTLMIISIVLYVISLLIFVITEDIYYGITSVLMLLWYMTFKSDAKEK